MPSGEPVRFSNADATFDEASVVLLGAPYEGAPNFRPGCPKGPTAIRRASRTVESYNIRNAIDLVDLALHDMGDLPVEGVAPEKMDELVEAGIARAAAGGRFPVLLGGDHAVTPAAVRALHALHPGLAVVGLDAHCDYRADYHGDPRSSACTSHRVAGTVGPRNVAWVGVRSAQRNEWERANHDRLRVVTTHQVRALGFAHALDVALGKLPRDAPVYLSIDIDAFDPAYAPGTGTPEPFGLTPLDVLHVITRLAPRLVGMDLTEVSPDHDGGISALLAARLVREVVTEREARK